MAKSPCSFQANFARNITSVLAQFSGRRPGNESAPSVRGWWVSDWGPPEQDVSRRRRPRLGDGRLVIGLTLRYDRIDNFWFCLLHEVAHVGRHLDRNQRETFIDDLSLRKMEGTGVDSPEAKADEWAEEAPITRAVWGAGERGIERNANVSACRQKRKRRVL